MLSASGNFCEAKDPATGRSVAVGFDYTEPGTVTYLFGSGERGAIRTAAGSLREVAHSLLKNYPAMYPYAASKSILL